MFVQVNFSFKMSGKIYEKNFSNRDQRQRSLNVFVTVNVSFNAYACHEVHFVAKFIWSRIYIPKSSRHEVTFHRGIGQNIQN